MPTDPYNVVTFEPSAPVTLVEFEPSAPSIHVAIAGGAPPSGSDLVNLLNTQLGGPTWQGGPGAPPVYTHDQPTPSTTWTIDHNLGFRYVNVVLLDASGEEFEADLDYVNTNQLIVTHGIPLSGQAIVKA